MATAKIQTGMRLTETTYEKLKVIASVEGRSLNNLVEYVLNQYIDRFEKENGPIPSEAD